MLSSGIQRYHMELMLSSGTTCYHLGWNVIIWDAMLSSGANVIIWDKMLLSGGNVIMLSSWANVIIWCYHAMLSSGMITPLFFIFPENFTHSPPIPVADVSAVSWPPWNTGPSSPAPRTTGRGWPSPSRPCPPRDWADTAASWTSSMSWSSGWTRPGWAWTSLPSWILS